MSYFKSFLLIGVAGIATVALCQKVELGFEPRKIVIPENSGLSDYLLDEIKKVEGTLLVAPEEAEFSELAIEPQMQQQQLYMGQMLQRKYGWVWKDKISGRDLALTPDGNLVVVRAVLGPAKFEDVYSANTNDGGGFPNYQVYPLVKAATLVMMGQIDAARQVPLPIMGGGNSLRVGSAPDITTYFITVRTADYANALASHQYVGAKRIAEFMQFANPEISINSYSWGLTNLTPAVLAAEADRLAQGSPVAVPLSQGELSKEDEYALLVESLAWNNSGNAFEGFSGRISSAGEEIVPILIEKFKVDNRINPSGMDYGYIRGIQTVRASIYALLQQKWSTIPSYDSRTMVIDTYADILAKEWEAQKSLSKTDRMVRSVLISNGESLSRIGRWFYESVGSTERLPYVAGKTYNRYEDVSPGDAQKLLELARTLLATDPLSNRGGFSGRDNLRLLLLCAAVGHEKALPMLRQYSSQLLAETENALNQATFKNMGLITAQRIALGDKKGALVDYSAAMKNIRSDWIYGSEPLTPAMEFPDDKEIQTITRELIEFMDKNKPEGDPNRIFPFSSVSSYELFKAPAVREYLISKLNNREVVGQLVFASSGSNLRVEFKVNDSLRNSWYSEEKVPEGGLPSTRPIEMGEYFMRMLGQNAFTWKPKFLVDSKEIKADIARTIKDLKAGNFKDNNRSAQVEIWKPDSK